MTETAFECLLDALNPTNRETAGAGYVELRENLVKFFTWRGCQEPEEYADETLNRVARKLAEGEQIKDFRSYVFGIARLLCFDANRAEIRQRVALAELPRVPAKSAREVRQQEIRHQCLDNCLQHFTAEERAFVLDYYQGERRSKIENRKGLLAKLSLSGSGLRMKALRLREKLETCVRQCCEKAV